LNAGFVDVFRKMNPDLKGAYTYYSWRGNAYANNVGWRLDYFVVSERLFEKVDECTIHKKIRNGSDHCPLSLVLRI
jgi:exodeoxyribonuclease-3